MYGDNEFLLAKAIKKYGRDKFIIATKVPPIHSKTELEPGYMEVLKISKNTVMRA